MNQTNPAPLPLTPTEVQAWSAVALIALFVNVCFPFSGLVIITLIYLILGPRDARLQHNVRAALNFYLTATGVDILLNVSAPLLPANFSLIYGVTAICLLIYNVFATILNIMAVCQGDRVEYGLSFKFIRAKPKAIVPLPDAHLSADRP